MLACSIGCKVSVLVAHPSLPELFGFITVACQTSEEADVRWRLYPHGQRQSFSHSGSGRGDPFEDEYSTRGYRVPFRERPQIPVIASISRRLVRRNRSEDLFFKSRPPVSGVVPRGEVVGVHDLGTTRLGQPCSKGGLSSTPGTVNTNKPRCSKPRCARPNFCCKVADTHATMMANESTELWRSLADDSAGGQLAAGPGIRTVSRLRVATTVCGTYRTEVDR